MNASTGGEGGRIFLFLGYGLENATRGPIPKGEVNCGRGGARVLRRMARGAVEMATGRNAKGLRGEGGGEGGMVRKESGAEQGSVEGGADGGRRRRGNC